MRCDRVGDDKTTFDKIWHVPFRREPAPSRARRWMDRWLVCPLFFLSPREREEGGGEGEYAQMRPLQGPFLNQHAADREVHELL